MTTVSLPVKTVDRAIDAYYGAMAELAAQHVRGEAQLRRAFEHLLTTVGKEIGWTLIAEETIANRKRPDATLRDANTLPRGYWEAKDSHDDLDAEIAKKIGLGYPLTNTIFEDSRVAALYQNGKRVLTIDLTKRADLADLLRAFFTHTEPAFEHFTTAVAEFRERIPDLAHGLLKKIEQERQQKNTAFVRAYVAFKQLCQTAIDPRISDEAIDEMLAQHLLTERLFRTVFDNPDFTRRNVIAVEIEKVIDALTSRAFNRREFQAGLDRFYLAIEAAAREVTDYQEKQEFLNTVYERFFQGFAVKQADTHGIVYTPQPIVDFMCASVEEVLQREFGRSLADRGVQILDPCTGTGNFIVNILNRIATTAPQHLEYKYRHDLFANEIMLLPYYIASMNIEHAYYERAGTYQSFDGLCFVDTLTLVEGANRGDFVQPSFELMSEKNTERVEAEKKAEIMVVIGNPPYNVGQANENDNNKNRKYDVIDGRVKDTYAKDSEASNRNKLSDAYVKFFRWASDRLNGRDGIVCYVSNNSFVDQISFDGMRKHLLEDFTQIWHIDLHGNVRKNPKLSGTTHNVFGIQVGVGITVAIRTSQNPNQGLWYYRAPENWRKTDKLNLLAKAGSISGIQWQELEPDGQQNWLTEGMKVEFGEFLAIGSKESKNKDKPEAIFANYSLGVNTNRDDWAYDFERESLISKMTRHIDFYNSEVDRLRRLGNDASIDEFVTSNDQRIKWSRDLKLDLKRGKYAKLKEAQLRQSLYRPFCKQWLFFDRIMNEEVYQQPHFFPTNNQEKENVVLCTTGIAADHQTYIASNTIVNLKCGVSGNSGLQTFPLYTYNEDGSNRRDNITDWALAQFQAAYGPEVTKRDIFHYVYAVLHHPAYRERYKENLKKELPRIPLVGYLPQLADADTPSLSADGVGLGWDQPAQAGFATPPTGAGLPAGHPPAVPAFRALVAAGARLADLHITYETVAPYPLREVVTPGVPFTWRVTKMALSKDKTALTYNECLRLEDIPPEVFTYRLGNRSALEWVIDQYQVSTDKRSGITTDPNRADDPEYIYNLVRRVITVSLETMRVVAGLPDLGLPGE